MSLKSAEQLNKNLKSNFINFDFQIWAVENTGTKLFKILNSKKTQYPNISILDIGKVRRYVNENSRPNPAD